MCEIFSTHRANERFSHEYRMSPHFYYCTKPEADDRVRTHGSGLKTCHLILFSFFISPSEKLPSIKHFQCLIGVGTKLLLELPIGWQRQKMRCCCSQVVSAAVACSLVGNTHGNRRGDTRKTKSKSEKTSFHTRQFPYLQLLCYINVVCIFLLTASLFFSPSSLLKTTKNSLSTLKLIFIHFFVNFVFLTFSFSHHSPASRRRHVLSVTKATTSWASEKSPWLIWINLIMIEAILCGWIFFFFLADHTDLRCLNIYIFPSSLHTPAASKQKTKNSRDYDSRRALEKVSFGRVEKRLTRLYSLATQFPVWNRTVLNFLWMEISWDTKILTKKNALNEDEDRHREINIW